MGVIDFLKSGITGGAGLISGNPGMVAEGAAGMVNSVLDVVVDAQHLKLYSVIQNTRPSTNIILWKHETEGFYNKSQLIVKESEEALFVKDGIIVATFGAGKHTLTTENYPVIDKLRRTITGGVTPFPCEIYFIDKTHKLDIKWGTDTPIQIRDAEFQFPVEIRARGSYSMQVTNSKKFFVKLTGDRILYTNENIRDGFKAAFQSIIKSTLAQKMHEYNKSVLDMVAEFKELENVLIEPLTETLDEYGIKLINFYIIDISVPSDDPNYKKISEAYAKAHAGRIELEVQGDMWNKLTAKELVKDVANNPGSGEAANLITGIGVGTSTAPVFSNLSNELFAPLKNINEEKKMVKCPNCQADVEEGSKFCGNCGNKMPEYYYCTKCGNKLESTDNFCKKCGTRRAMNEEE